MYDLGARWCAGEPIGVVVCGWWPMAWGPLLRLFVGHAPVRKGIARESCALRFALGFALWLAFVLSLRCYVLVVLAARPQFARGPRGASVLT